MARSSGCRILLKSGEEKARPIFGKIDLDQEEPLVVAERNVIARPEFLDQFAFEQNRFRFAADGVRFEVPCRVEQGAVFRSASANLEGRK